MAIFTAIATAIGTAIGLTGTALTIFTAIGATVLSIGVSSLLAKRMAVQGAGGADGGGRVQLPPATDNKIPVVYGSAFVGGPVTDAKISSDQKIMWYVVALAEHTDTTVGSGYTYDTTNIYYDGKKVQFGSNGRVTGLINNSPGGTEIDTKIDGKIYIYLFTNGSSSGVNTGGQTAIQILSDSDIPVGQRWTATDTMTNCAFAIVKVIYDTDAGTTNLGALMCKITNSIDKPGDALLDYMLNTRYGCAIPLSRIDTASLTALNAYSDALITYVPVGGGSATQARYRVNGPINTGSNCLDNLQTIVDSCDCWLQYSELSAKWKVVINQSYTDYTTITNLFLVDDDNLIGGINVAPINLNETYNELEVAYPNRDIKDQTDYQVIELADYQPGIISPNEAVNRLNIDLPIVNNPVQSIYLGVRRLLQSREDLTISLRTDYSGIQIEAGDVIRVKNNQYGWDILNTGNGKLFRVATVSEEKYADGSLGVSLTAFEYNDTIYADNAIQDFVLDPNLGITDPNIIGTPIAPTVTLDLANTIAEMKITGTVPSLGLITNLNFNYGTSSNSANHVYYTTVSNANGAPLLANSTYTITSSDLAANTYYWSVTARNQSVGVRGPSSNAVTWPGGNVTTPTTFTACNANSSGTLVTSDSIANLVPGGLVIVTSGTGTLQANTVVANVVSNTQFNLNLVPNVALSNACIQIINGGIGGNNIQPNSITLINFNRNLNITEGFGGSRFTIAGNTVVMPINAAANTTRNVPIYFTGTSVSTNNYYPWYQGTSSTTVGTNGNNYYSANSTSTWNPLNASTLTIADGEDNWYTVLYDDFPSGTIGANQTYFMNFGFTAVSNTANTLVQVVEGIEYDNVGYYEAITDQLHTMTLQANLPQSFAKVFNITTSNRNANMTSGAVFVRCVTSGANVTFVQGSLASSKGQNPYF